MQRGSRPEIRSSLFLRVRSQCNYSVVRSTINGTTSNFSNNYLKNIQKNPNCLDYWYIFYSIEKRIVVMIISRWRTTDNKRARNKTSCIVQGRYYFRVNELSDKPPLDKTRAKVRNTTMAKVARSTDKRTSSNNGTRSACYWTIIPGSHCQSFPYQTLHITAPTTPSRAPRPHNATNTTQLVEREGWSGNFMTPPHLSTTCSESILNVIELV